MDRTVPAPVQTFMGTMMTEILNPVMAVIFGAALVYFLFGLMVFIFGAGQESKRSEGKRHMLWGLLGMVVMVSSFTIIRLTLRTFGVKNEELPAPIETWYVGEKDN
jgi:hypothetical protein